MECANCSALWNFTSSKSWLQGCFTFLVCRVNLPVIALFCCFCSDTESAAAAAALTQWADFELLTHTHTEYSPTNSTGGHHSRAISYANTQRKHWWGRQDGTVITLRCTRQFYSPLSPHSTIELNWSAEKEKENENLSLSSHANNNNGSKAKKAAVNELKPFGYLDGLAKKGSDWND